MQSPPGLVEGETRFLHFSYVQGLSIQCVMYGLVAGVFSNPDGGFSDCDSIEIGHGVVMSRLVLWEMGAVSWSGVRRHGWQVFAVEIVAQMVRSWGASRCTRMWVIHGCNGPWL